MTDMRSCCEEEAKAHIKKHRDAARCDTCGSLILGYSDEADFKKMIRQLQENKIPYETVQKDSLHLVIKVKT